MSTAFGRNRLALLACVVLLCFTAVAFAASAPRQSSITLQGSDVTLCNNNDTAWSLDKVADIESIVNAGLASWTVTVTKGATSDNVVTVDGFVRVTNTGSGPATIGNIVVNLQRFSWVNKKTGSRWVSAAADVADATNGDAAVSANIAAAASTESASYNALVRGNADQNYFASGAQGTFVESAASGSLEFTDADSNTIWAITPEQTIAPGASVALVFEAEFNNTDLRIPVGEQVRAEVIVSFGNAGTRGGSGSSATNIDVSGNGVIDADEACVRSVPTRITKAIPALITCNDPVVLTDPEATTIGNVMAGDFDNGEIGDGAVIDASGADPELTTYAFNVTAGVTATADPGGWIYNDAYLDGGDCTIQVVIGTDPLSGAAIYYDFPCCVGIHLHAYAGIPVNWVPSGPDFTTYTQGGWGATPNGNNPASLLAANFAALYPNGVMVGVAGAAGNAMLFTSADAVGAYLPAGGKSGVLTADLVNPTSSSAGTLGGQVLALQLNVGFSAGGVTQGPGGPLGNLILVGTNTSLDGMSVAQILAAAEQAIGVGALPAGYSFGSLNDLIGKLNEAFDEGTATAWAQVHLTP